MTREEMIELLCKTICATEEEASAALEASEWDILGAGRRLLSQRERERCAEVARTCRRDSGWKTGSPIRDLIARVFPFAARRGDSAAL